MNDAAARWARRWLPTAVLLLGALPAPGPLGVASAESDGTDDRVLSVIGRAERVALTDGGIIMEAKVDTGADSTSIDARKIERFQRDGEDWVRFEIRTNDGQVASLERRVVDTVTIVGAGEDREERLVVQIALCLADVQQNVEVNLADRSGLDYRLLLGREFLARGGFLVNVTQAFSHEPLCESVVER